MKLTKNFNLIEFACKDGTGVPDKYMSNVTTLATQLQALRDELSEPVHIVSAYRTTSHNKAVGGAKNSQHLTGKAADIVVKGRTPKQVKAVIESLIKSGKMLQGGIGLYNSFVHYDIRGVGVRW